jgi:mono/diheme cytochrome c family protein
MLSLIALAATVGGYPPVCHTASSYAATGYGAQYVATPYVQNYGAGYGYAPQYAAKVVTAFVPIQQYERTEIVGDAARASQFAQARIAADTSLAQAIVGMSGELKSFREQVKQATQTQDQAFQAKQAPPPVAQYPAQPSPQSPAPPSKSAPADYGQVPEPPPPSPQAPAKAFPSLPPVNVPPPPTDASQGDPGTFPTQPTPAPLQTPQATNAVPSQARLAATQTLARRCGSCHTGNGSSGGFKILESKDQLAALTPDQLRTIDNVAFSGAVVDVDPATGKVTRSPMPPNGKGMSAEEYGSIRSLLWEATVLTANTQGPR